MKAMSITGPRKATPKDARELAELHNAVADDLARRLGPGYWGTQRTTRRMVERLNPNAQSYPHRHYWVWIEECGERIVGSVLLSPEPASFWRKSCWMDPDAEALCVYDLAVSPGHQGRGIGTELMKLAESESQRMGLPYVRLDAFKEDPRSNAFYQKLGYSLRGELNVHSVLLNLYERQASIGAQPL